MRQDQVLLVADADLVEAKRSAMSATASICSDGGIARHAADRLQRDRRRWRSRACRCGHDVVRRRHRANSGVRRLGPLDRIGALPAASRRPAARNRPRSRVDLGAGSFERRRRSSACVFGLDLALQFLDAGLVHEDLDARLVLVVAAAVAGCRRAGSPCSRRAARPPAGSRGPSWPTIGVRPRPPPT